MIEGLLERDSSKDASGTLLDSIYLQKRYPKNDLQVFTTSVFRIAHPDHVPYIFVDVIDSQERAQKKLSELADNYLISSIISVVNLIDEDKLKAIESDRKKEEDEKTMRKVQEIRRDYPYGFNRFCAKNGISEDQFVNRYASFLNSLDEIRQIQRTEDQRKREEARRQHENAIINMARSLVSTYPNAARENGYSASSTIDYGTAQTILSKESLWKEIETLYYNRFELFGVTKSVSGLPHKFFFDYYPTNKYTETDLSKEQLSSRSFIWGFKDGKDYYQTKAVEMVSEFINNSGLKHSFAVIRITKKMAQRIHRISVIIGVFDEFQRNIICDCYDPLHIYIIIVSEYVDLFLRRQRSERCNNIHVEHLHFFGHFRKASCHTCTSRIRFNHSSFRIRKKALPPYSVSVVLCHKQPLSVSVLQL